MSYGTTEFAPDARSRERIDEMVFSARKSGLVAFLLWLFLGGFGVHNFYLRRPRAGGLQMAGTLFVYCTYVSDGVWPVVGLAAGIPLGISLLIDLFKIPVYVAACSERLRQRLTDSLIRSGS
jgi:TM2 domain-containing membrane protein YozV